MREKLFLFTNNSKANTKCRKVERKKKQDVNEERCSTWLHKFQIVSLKNMYHLTPIATYTKYHSYLRFDFWKKKNIFQFEN